MPNDVIHNFGDFVMSRFGLDYGMFDSREKSSLREVLDNLSSSEVQSLKFTKGELRVWQDPNGTVNFELMSGLILHSAKITIGADGESKWIYTIQNF